MNRSGYLRILEASIATIIVLGFLFFVYTKEDQPTSIDYSERARDILEELSHSNDLRNAVLSYPTGQQNPPAIPQEIDQFVKVRIPEQFLKYELRICAIDSVCGPTTYIPGNVFSGERVISATVDSTIFEPKKIKIFIWSIS